MEISLPSGASAELRTQLKAKDKFAVQSVIRTSGDGTVSEGGGVLSLMETALLVRLLESWTYDAPLPSAHACDGCVGDSTEWHKHVRDEFGEVLDIDDFNALEDTITPFLDKVMKSPNLKISSGSAASS